MGTHGNPNPRIRTFIGRSKENTCYVLLGYHYLKNIETVAGTYIHVYYLYM
jgi:hypothetical protein